MAMVPIKGLQVMSQQECNARHRMEQEQGGLSARRLAELRAAGARRALLDLPDGVRLEGDTWHTDPREAEYLAYLAGKLDPRD